MEYLKPTKHYSEGDACSSDASFCSQMDVHKDAVSMSSNRSANVKFQKQFSVGGISIRSQGSTITVSQSISSLKKFGLLLK